MSDEESKELGDDLPRYRVVTIMWDENAEGPAEVDLGDLSPWVAVSLLATVVDSLRMVLTAKSSSIPSRKGTMLIRTLWSPTN